MQRQKRPFYIIGHNPNTINEAREFLENGANALEPDIVHAEGRFYVSHGAQPSYDNVPRVEEYLQQLKALVISEQYDLSLLIWDMKDTDFDPGQFMSIVKENFSGYPCDGVAMLMTHGDDHDFLTRYHGIHDTVGIGVDESNIPPSTLEKIFINSGQKNFSYADGITTFLNKPGVYKNITEAQGCRNRHEPSSFSLIYTWVLSKEASILKYLDTYIDGIMVDVDSVKLLKELIIAAPYNEAYELAQNGYNPFTAIGLPKYTLTVKTSDKRLAGTDAEILFTLTGSSGLSLKSLPFNANEAGALERGSTTCIVLEGMELGEIESVAVQVLTGGIGAAWLPESISVESKLLTKPVGFIFKDDQQEWIKKESGAVVKYPV